VEQSTVVVVGAGQAGCQVASSLRDDGFAGRIVLVGAEEHLPYQRPPLSKGHLTGKSAREALFLRPEAWYAEQAIEVRTATTATAIDRTAREVHLDDGSALPYDTLVLALGSRHRQLPQLDTDLAGVLALRTLSEADEVRALLERADHVVVVGGGFIGLEVAATAAGLGKVTTVLEVAPRLMGRVLSATTADFLVEAHRRRGLVIELQTSAESIRGAGGRVVAVTTSDGRELPADLVLLGIGAEPEIALAVEAGLAADGGILVDQHLRTSDPRIFAIGDCAASPNPFAGGRVVRLESVQNATAQARCAAAVIAGGAEPYCSVPWFWSDQADLKLQIAGLAAGHDEVVVTGSRPDEHFSTWCFAGGRLVGVESVNRAADHMAARKILASGRALAPEQVSAPAFDPKAAAAGAR
jgi:3-phenylpropionate/trans-cinnamate dioxygenase ferredoxin reductase subunit